MDLEGEGPGQEGGLKVPKVQAFQEKAPPAADGRSSGENLESRPTLLLCGP